MKRIELTKILDNSMRMYSSSYELDFDGLKDSLIVTLDGTVDSDEDKILSKIEEGFLMPDCTGFDALLDWLGVRGYNHVADEKNLILMIKNPSRLFNKQAININIGESTLALFLYTLFESVVTWRNVTISEKTPSTKVTIIIQGTEQEYIELSDLMTTASKNIEFEFIK